MNYRYRAMTQDGQKLQGIIDANDERQARLRLREEGLFLLDIRPQKSSGVKTRRPRISHSELTLFTRQLATLSAAALPLEESLAVIGQQSSNKRLADVLNQVRSAILEGHPLSDALQHFPTLFDSLYRTLVKAGEKSGLLAPVLEKLADYNENRQKIRSKLIQSLIYPCMLTTVAIVVVIILLTAVVPKITEQFVHMKQQLPLSTRILLGLSDTLQRTGPTLLATVFIVAVGFWLWLKRGNNRHRFHAMLLRVALIGPLICAINSARYLRTLSILQSSGVPLLDGMNLSTESLNNLEIRQRLANAAENVRQGNSIHLSLEQTAIFPPMMLYMVASGEK
ncbi:TPA: type II secretion system inner membrane protein GspF, partial [Escherichia coli]